MAIVDIDLGQIVCIPAIQLTNGLPLRGVLRASDGETFSIELLDPLKSASIPERIDGDCVLTWEKAGVYRSCPVQITGKAHPFVRAKGTLQERRDAPRFQVDFELSYTVIPAGQVREAADAVMARVNSLAEPELESNRLMRVITDDPMENLRQEVVSLREMMSELLAKVDHLTTLVAGQKPAGASGKIMNPIAITNCSGTGLGMLCTEPYASGDYLRLRMTLKSMPRTVIDCLAVVARSEEIRPDAAQPERRHFDIGVRFTHIHESDRESLIHYLFKIQRRLLRDRREARDAILE